MPLPGAAMMPLSTAIIFFAAGGPSMRMTAAPSTAPAFARPSYDGTAYQSIR